MDYYDDEERQPWWRRSPILITVGVSVVGVLMLLFVVQPWSGETPGPAQPGQTGEATSSVCGLPDGDQTVPEAAPVTDWRNVEQLTLPVSPTTFGPGQETNGIYSCYGRNPSGAVMAAAMDLALDGSSSVDQVEYVRARYVHQGHYERLLADAQAGAAQAETSMAGELAGFRVLDYSKDRASVEVVARILEGELADRLLSVRYELRWVDGDWRMVAPATDISTMSAPSSLAGYVEWSPTTAGGGSSPSASSQSRETDRPSVVSRSEPAGVAVVASGMTGTREALVGARRTAVVTRSALTLADEDADAASHPCGEKKWSVGCGKALVGGALTPGLTGSVDGLEKAGGAAGSAVAESAFAGIAQDMVDAQEWALENLLTAWLRYPDPDLQGPTSTMVWLQDKLQLFVVFVTVGAVLLGAYRLAITGKFEHLSDLGMVFVRVILTGGLVGVVTTVGLEIGDSFTKWILAQVEYDFSLMFALNASSPTWILLIAGFIIVIVQLIQFVIMIFRYGCVIYLCGSLTLFAAASNTRTGKQGWEKSMAWLLAFVFYKPVAALIYAVAIKMSNPDRGAADQVAAIGMTVLAIFALPAMMRLIAPHTGALGGANAGALAGATVGAALATGAVVATAGGAAAAGAASGGGFAGGGGGFAGAGGGGGAATMTGGGSGGAAGAAAPEGAAPSQPGSGGAGPTGLTTTTPGASGAGGADGDGSPGLGSTVDGGQPSGANGGGSGSSGSFGQAPSGAGTSGAGDVMRGLDTGASGGRRVAGAAEGVTDDDDGGEQ